MTSARSTFAFRPASRISPRPARMARWSSLIRPVRHQRAADQREYEVLALFDDAPEEAAEGGHRVVEL
ncbi:hypothetical protein, partial [Streptomyces thioluteus]|uniref:hypothetical protein n=1 Tax=Streptomyces thioluteus TaxID=66431 RepID=UPI0031F0983D